MRAQTACILTLSASLLVCLARLTVHFLVVPGAVAIILHSGLFDLIVLPIIGSATAVAIIIRSRISDGCLVINQVYHN